MEKVQQGGSGGLAKGNQCLVRGLDFKEGIEDKTI